MRKPEHTIYDDGSYVVEYQADFKENPNFVVPCNHTKNNTIPHVLHMYGGDGFSVCLECLLDKLKNINVIAHIQGGIKMVDWKGMSDLPLVPGYAPRVFNVAAARDYLFQGTPQVTIRNGEGETFEVEITKFRNYGTDMQAVEGTMGFILSLKDMQEVVNMFQQALDMREG